jgi:hypothetical protein
MYRASELAISISFHILQRVHRACRSPPIWYTLSSPDLKSVRRNDVIESWVRECFGSFSNDFGHWTIHHASRQIGLLESVQLRPCGECRTLVHVVALANNVSKIACVLINLEQLGVVDDTDCVEPLLLRGSVERDFQLCNIVDARVFCHGGRGAFL